MPRRTTAKPIVSGTWPNKAARETSSRTQPTKVISRTDNDAAETSQHRAHRRTRRRARKSQASGEDARERPPTEREEAGGIQVFRAAVASTTPITSMMSG